MLAECGVQGVVVRGRSSALQASCSIRYLPWLLPLAVRSAQLRRDLGTAGSSLEISSAQTRFGAGRHPHPCACTCGSWVSGVILPVDGGILSQPLSLGIEG